jgi:hypothetical protein
MASTDVHSIAPKRRGSLKRRIMPLSKVRSAWSCFSGAVVAAAGSNRKLPDIPRCRINVPLPQPNKRYFARRSTLSIVTPPSVLFRSDGTGQRRFGFRIVTQATRRPSRWGAIPRRMTSTSGSSGNCDYQKYGSADKKSIKKSTTRRPKRISARSVPHTRPASEMMAGARAGMAAEALADMAAERTVQP